MSVSMVDSTNILDVLNNALNEQQEVVTLQEIANKLSGSKKIEPVWNTDKTDLVGSKHTLMDDTVINFSATVTEDDTTKEYLFTSTDIAGYSATYTVSFSKVVRVITLMGQPVNHIEYVPMGTTNILLTAVAPANGGDGGDGDGMVI